MANDPRPLDENPGEPEIRGGDKPADYIREPVTGGKGHSGVVLDSPEEDTGDEEGEWNEAGGHDMHVEW